MRVGLLGGGVIGGGWAARFLLNGFDVQMYDPDPEAPRKVGEVLANARRATTKLVMPALPAEGTLTFLDSPEAAATGADFVQESAPERLELKQQLLRRASTAAGPDIVFASSTSGLLPSLLQQGMTHPERLVVGHPFNPVYLLPLVEICGGSQSSAAAADRAAAVYETVGMHPLRLRKEIDGFVADRLLEALWREALWLVNDGVATASEIDDAIRFGAGLRWSFMGTFLVYRIAGGEAGMRHFMAQFGPTLQWPWTKLMDVPELTDELLDTIVSQSDEQAGAASIRELEVLRDDCLIAVMQGLRTVGYGAGEVLDRYERQLFGRGTPTAVEPDLTAPVRVHECRVPTDWVDYNGHTNDSRYMQLSSEAGDRFLRLIGMDSAYLESGRSFFTVESHVNYVAQTRAGDQLYVTVQLLSHDQKRMRLFTAMRRSDDDALVATAEHMMLHVDTTADRASPADPVILAKLAAIAEYHDRLPAPPQAGRHIGQPSR
ncbi:MAG: bifunctional 3-hydroxyacyl-CoA dehydrogenase/thioesterase [Acidimicrobiaceae bacterium]|nr:MAG: bifunctional 3-hydroxyacyl-CoA dehydrogenase/thioesterase [Acidimicrobiaceae bacterium]